MKKLYKSDTDQILDGVIAGIGEYYDIDPTLLRLAFIVIVLFTGVFPGIIAYIIALFVVPERPHAVSTIVTPPRMNQPEPKKTAEQTTEQTHTQENAPSPENSSQTPSYEKVD